MSIPTYSKQNLNITQIKDKISSVVTNYPTLFNDLDFITNEDKNSLLLQIENIQNQINSIEIGSGLKGDKGDTGANGLDGKDGINGLDGKDGVNGSNGTNGTNGTNGIDGTNGTDGKDGINGTNGTNGIDGKDGVVDVSLITNLQSQIDSINQKLAQIDFVKLSQLLSDSLTSETLSTEFDEVFDDYVLTNLE